MLTLATDNPANANEPRKVVMHVNFAEKDRLGFVLNNIENILDYYQGEGKEVTVRVVCHGPGLHMLRNDTSPVKDRLLRMADNLDQLRLYACSNTIERMTKAEGKQPEVFEQAILVPAGLVEIIELQRLGWTYLKP